MNNYVIHTLMPKSQSKLRSGWSIALMTSKPVTKGILLMNIMGSPIMRLDYFVDISVRIEDLKPNYKSLAI